MNAALSKSAQQPLIDVSLDDKYTLAHGRAFMSGVQALVRLPMLQQQRDALAGLRTAGFCSGCPAKYHGVALVPGVAVQHRDELDRIQREFREIEATTVLIYDQVCATEKRRKRKRGTLAEPDERMVINELVCEGCGDFGEPSNSLSIEPLETEFGRTGEPHQERAWVARYQAMLQEISVILTSSPRETSATCYEKTTELAAIPQDIRGFGDVKARASAEAMEK